MNFGPQNCGAVPGRLSTTRCGEDGRRLLPFFQWVLIFEQSVNRRRGPRWWPQMARLRRGLWWNCGSFASPIAVRAACVALHAFFHPIYGNLLGVAISHENPLNGPAKMRRRAFQAAPLNRRWEK